jgi:hypothetical protein
MPYLGSKGLFIGIGEETTWGTAVAATVWLHGVSESMKTVVEHRKRPVIGDHSASARTHRRKFAGLTTSGGTFEAIGTFEGLGLLLKHGLYGSPGTTGPVTGIYTHTYQVGPNAPTGGLTVRVVRGDGSMEVFEGARVSKLTVMLTAGDLMRVRVELVAQDSTRTSADTPSHTTSRDLEVAHYHGANATFNANSYPYRMFELTIDNKIARRNLVGSGLTQDPKPSDDQEIAVKLETEYSDDTLYNAQIAGTQSDLVLNFNGPASRVLTITVNDAYIDDNAANVGSVAVIAETSNFRGTDDGTNLGVKFVIANTQSSAVAA